MRFFRHCLIFATALAPLAAGAEVARTAEPLTHIGEVRSLPRTDAAKGVPVHVQGVVTWRGLRGQLVVQDDTGGCWIYVADALRRQSLAMSNELLDSIHVGHLLDIEGVSDAGGYAPGIFPQSLRIVGERPVPPAAPMNPARFFSGTEAGLRAEARGTVQDFKPAEGGWVLDLNANPGHFTVEFPKNVLPDPAALVDAEVRVTGVAVTRVNSRGELTMPRIYGSQTSELIVEAPATPPFTAPLVPLDALLPFSARPTGPHRLRVIGVMTYALTGKLLYLQEGSTAVRVETRSTEKFQPGDRIEAAGFVDMTRHVGSLTGAQVRKIGTAETPPPVDISPEEILALNRTALANGQLAQPTDYDGNLVRFRASLLAVQSAPDPKQPGRRLTLERGDMILTAILHEGDAQSLDALLPGSELEVTGIVQLEYTPVAAPRLSLMPTQLDVVLRRAADVRVMRAPSWWTAGRLLAAVAIIAVAFGAAIVWAWQLRRQVRSKTQQLATEMRARRDAAVEFQATLRERNRLAANLHDTLLQTLSGIGFQIGASEAEAALPGRDGKPLFHLTVTRKILDHAMKELRGAVWALRSLPAEGKGLPEALRSLVERMESGQSARIDLNTEGDLSHVCNFVAGNLLLATQEAMHNALKHGSPRLITLNARPEENPPRIVLRVRDDGVGFTVGQEVGATHGHFGLVGMRERINRLDGTVQIESAPGQGTTVQFEVPLRAYDESLA